MTQKICKQCNKEFTPDNPQTRNVKFCSKECREKFYYHNYRKGYAQAKRGEYAPNKIKCALCERWYVQIASHVQQVHGMSAREYKEHLGLDVKRGLILEDYREVKRETQDPKTLQNLNKGKKFWFKKGSTTAGRYKRSKQTMERLRKQGKWIAENYSKKNKKSL